MDACGVCGKDQHGVQRGPPAGSSSRAHTLSMVGLQGQTSESKHEETKDDSRKLLSTGRGMGGRGLLSYSTSKVSNVID